MVEAPRDGEDVMRLSKAGVWRSVDPKHCKPAHAFVAMLGPNGDTPRRGRPMEAFAIVAVCSCKTHAACPASLALDFACQREGSASVLRRKATR